MITKQIPYQPPSEYLFLDQKRKLRIVTRMKKTIAKFDISSQELGIVTV